MALDPRPDPGMVRAMAPVCTLEMLEQAAEKVQAASEWSVEAHFLATSRGLLR